MASELSNLLANVRPSRFFHGTTKPFVRWWWLSGPFTRADISSQLRWVRDQNFGGVELAWIYPNWIEEDGDDRRRPPLLSTEWSELVAFAKSEAESLGLGCDFTFGSCWPFGGSWLQEGDALRTFEGLSEQRLRCSWEVEAFDPKPKSGATGE